MNEQQKQRIVEEAQHCEYHLHRAAIKQTPHHNFGADDKFYAERFSAEAFRIAQEAR